MTAKVWQKAVQELGQYRSTCNGLNLNSSWAVNNLYDSSLFWISSLFWTCFARNSRVEFANSALFRVSLYGNISQCVFSQTTQHWNVDLNLVLTVYFSVFVYHCCNCFNYMNFVKVVVIWNLAFHETQLGYFERACCRNVRCQGQNVDTVIHAIKKIATAACSLMSSTLSLQHELPYFLVCVCTFWFLSDSCCARFPNDIFIHSIDLLPQHEWHEGVFLWNLMHWS